MPLLGKIISCAHTFCPHLEARDNTGFGLWVVVGPKEEVPVCVGLLVIYSGGEAVSIPLNQHVQGGQLIFPFSLYSSLSTSCSDGQGKHPAVFSHVARR